MNRGENTVTATVNFVEMNGTQTSKFYSSVLNWQLTMLGKHSKNLLNLLSSKPLSSQCNKITWIVTIVQIKGMKKR